MRASKNIWVCKFKIKVNFYTLHRTTHKQCHRTRCFMQVKTFRKMSLCPRLRASNLRNFWFWTRWCLWFCECLSFSFQKFYPKESSIRREFTYNPDEVWAACISQQMAHQNLQGDGCGLSPRCHHILKQSTAHRRGNINTENFMGDQLLLEYLRDIDIATFMYFIFKHCLQLRRQRSYSERKSTLHVLLRKKTFKKGRQGRK